MTDHTQTSNDLRVWPPPRSASGPGDPTSVGGLRVERVPQRVAQEIECDDQHHEQVPGMNRYVGTTLKNRTEFASIAAECDVRSLHAHAEE